jgi:thiamine phosphate synthase YjbQ (UPF0047 family)
MRMGYVRDADKPSVSIPLIAGRLALGDHQAVFLAEFDGPRERAIYATVS